MKHLLLITKTFMVGFFISTIAHTAAPQWGEGRPNNQVWFHPSDEPYYPFSNFYEIDHARSNNPTNAAGHARYPVKNRFDSKKNLHNTTSFPSLEIGFGGQCLTWRSTEHFFQTMKMFGKDNFMQLYTDWQNLTPGDLFREIRKPENNYNFQAYDNIKLYVMYAAVKAKFSKKNKDLHDLLLNTGDQWIVEHVEINQYQPKGDSYWGDTPSAGRPQGGNNYLGKILMIVRAELSGGYPKNWVPSMPSLSLEKIQAAEKEIAQHQTTWLKSHPHLVDSQQDPFELRIGTRPPATPAAPHAVQKSWWRRLIGL